MKLLSWVLMLCLFSMTGAPIVCGQQEKAGPGVAYQQDIAPIFEGRCVSCHSGTRPPDGLHLDSYQGVIAGSRIGKVLIPGKPQQSEIVKRIRGISKPRMPKNGPPWLSDSEISLIEKWIADGASE
jgi:hypothetical protein